MKPTLTWKGDLCANAPDGWAVETVALADGGYGGMAYLIGSHVGEHHTGSHPTAEAAQLACEAALWRLGGMPLPKWHRVHDAWRLDACNEAWANVTYDDGWEWSVYVLGEYGTATAKGTNCEGYCDDADTAKRTAEAHLRAAIALVLEAE